MDPYYFFPKTDQEKEKISNLWKYFPDLNPVLEVDGAIEDGMGDTNLNTPYAPNTPGAATDYLRGKTPGMGEFGAFHQSPQVFTPGGLTPGMTPRGGMTPNRDTLPHNMIYSPYVRQNIDQGDNTQAMSPILPISTQPMSPSMSSNLNSTNNMMPSGSELRYSPLSPVYNNSPMRGYSPSSNRHYSGMSPSYSYNSPSSPNYSPNSSGSPSLSGQNSGSSLLEPTVGTGGSVQRGTAVLSTETGGTAGVGGVVGARGRVVGVGGTHAAVVSVAGGGVASHGRIVVDWRQGRVAELAS
eukprot:TRINITY_DN71217_c0_g1_i1.p1 TRINITY_DN71217_c0_g1~~TRINITY_DN71217_c0_g1_i1.p1  ORF type:complete len:323 (+),score=30.75 TRINITY_DN71217_c0_g1_i1:79-969(+)